MTTKSCPECSLRVPLQLKSCRCGFRFSQRNEETGTMRRHPPAAVDRKRLAKGFHRSQPSRGIFSLNRLGWLAAGVLFVVLVIQQLRGTNEPTIESIKSPAEQTSASKEDSFALKDNKRLSSKPDAGGAPLLERNSSPAERDSSTMEDAIDEEDNLLSPAKRNAGESPLSKRTRTAMTSNLLLYRGKRSSTVPCPELYRS